MSDLSFSSDWQIDQLVDSGEVLISSEQLAEGDLNLPTIEHGLGRRPYVIIMYRAANSIYWYEPGLNLQQSVQQTPQLTAVWVDEQKITLRIGNFFSQDVYVRYWIYKDGH